MKYTKVLSLILLLGLSACGDTSSDTEALSVPPLKAFSNSKAPLQRASHAQFERFIKNGIFLARLQQSTAHPPASPYSTSNQLVAGVAEGDRIKFAGRYLFIAGSTQTAYNREASKTFVRIMDLQQPQATQVNELTLSPREFTSQHLYLHKQTLVSVMMGSNPHFAEQFNQSGVTSEANSPGHIELTFSDVSLPAQAQVGQRFAMDGTLLGSRLVGNKLYIIAKHDLTYSDFIANDKEQSYARLQATELPAMLPRLTNLTEQTSQPLVTSENCYIPADATENDGYHGLTTITSVDVENPTDITTACVSARSDGFYMSPSALYLYSYFFTPSKSDQGNTSLWDPKGIVLHKFTLTEQGASYQATGQVPGVLARASDAMAATRFDERDGVLRVLTSRDDAEIGNLHQLHLLQAEGNNLAIIAQLPNAQHPQPIGKVDPESSQVEEQVYAVRYVNDRAYVVTFQQSAPLYVIDLSDPRAPKIIGELDVPGYSTYLHPVAENLLLGVGQQVSAETAEGIGTQVSLFDVSDPTAPLLLGAHYFTEQFTPLEYDYRALAMVTEQTQVRFSLPLVSWQVAESEGAVQQWYNENSLAAFTISLQEKPSLEYMGRSEAQLSAPIHSDLPLGFSEADRGLINAEQLFYIHGNYVWQSLWHSPSNNRGPF
ncbi:MULTISPECIES: beta-propeller domain-containing protein [unclassified Pseudoalteromonas]|uniref:beta-propeller domain-containing protein n=1 Tax=unclassified Pseudoalteromonas TaxID=194690 RepID=UPI0030151066